jgi:hypothetical protein
MSSLRAGAMTTFARLGPRSFGIGAAFVAALVLVVGLLERREDLVHAADRTLVGAVFGIALPVLGYLVLGRASDGRRLDAALDVLARHGRNRRQALLGSVLAAAAALGAAGMLLASLGVVCARGIGDPRLLGDLAVSSAIGLGAGACYACWFALGSQLGARGGGRIWVLILDWLLGTGTTALAAPWPRAHLRNLLGAEPVLGMPQWSAPMALSLLALSCLTVSVLRAPP